MPPENPYAAPRDTSTVDTPTSGPATAIFIGAAIGNGIDFIFGIVATWAALWLLTYDGVPLERLYVTMGHSLPYLVLSHVVGAGCMVVGGRWTARLSRENPVSHAWVAGVISNICVFVQLNYPYDLPLPEWSKITSLVMPIPGYVLGAYWERRRVNGGTSE